MVNQGLKGLGCETLYLHYKAKVKHARKVRNVLKSYFPRYVFAAISQDFYSASKLPGVSGIVSGLDGPLSIPSEVIHELRSRGDHNGLITGHDAQIARRRRSIGEAVRILDGPLEGFFATILQDSGDSVRLMVQMFRGQVEAEVLPASITSPERRRIHS